MASDFAGQTCGIYPRVSSRKQSKKDRTSLGDQEQACRDYAAERGMLVEEACVKPESYTSTVMNRPELNQLLATMTARRVPNLIIDRADRMTRAGQIAAVQFLQQFTRAGITLHIVSMEVGDEDDALVVRDDKGVKDFLDAAYDAQQQNKKRVRIVKRAKRSRARAGHYLRGNRPPYGFRYVPTAHDAEGNVTERRLEPDTRTYHERGWATVFAPNPHAARLAMLDLYASGASCQTIANRLTAAHVPTSLALAGRSGGAPGTWWDRTVRYIVDNPLNEGKLVNFRHTYTLVDPDDSHEEEWVKVRPAPESERIVVQPADGGPTPLLAGALAARYATRRATRRTLVPARPGAAPVDRPALLAGQVAVCAGCGGWLGYHTVRRRNKTYQYYYCRRHVLAPSTCVGLSFPVPYLDPGAWLAVAGALNDLGHENDSYLDTLARQQAGADYSGQSGQAGENLADLRAIRADFAQQVDLLTDDLFNLRTATGREAIRRKIDRLEPEIAEADRKIAALERQASRTAERRQVLNDYLYQWSLYSDLVLRLDPYKPEDIPVMQAILQLVGARLTVGKNAEGEPDIAVELLITPTAAQPWFSRAALLDSVAQDVRDCPPPAPNGPEAEHRSLPNASSSCC